MRALALAALSLAIVSPASASVRSETRAAHAEQRTNFHHVHLPTHRRHR